ncbi:MAG: PTS sugar transporter subunit IIA [Halofilum sp. (in: g-proteobacteria)]
MSIGLITITHNGIGEQVVDAACQILGQPHINVRHLVFAPTDCIEDVEQSLLGAIKEIDTGAGVLVLSDLFGATPCNIAHRAMGEHEVRVLSGINLPMVLRTLNYAYLDLAQVVERAAEGGRAGVIECRRSHDHDQ